MVQENFAPEFEVFCNIINIINIIKLLILSILICYIFYAFSILLYTVKNTVLLDQPVLIEPMISTVIFPCLMAMVEEVGKE